MKKTPSMFIAAAGVTAGLLGLALPAAATTGTGHTASHSYGGTFKTDYKPAHLYCPKPDDHGKGDHGKDSYGKGDKGQGGKGQGGKGQDSHGKGDKGHDGKGQGGNDCFV
jgi:hypothetical protein